MKQDEATHIEQRIDSGNNKLVVLAVSYLLGAIWWGSSMTEAVRSIKEFQATQSRSITEMLAEVRQLTTTTAVMVKDVARLEARVSELERNDGRNHPRASIK